MSGWTSKRLELPLGLVINDYFWPSVHDFYFIGVAVFSTPSLVISVSKATIPTRQQ